MQDRRCGGGAGGEGQSVLGVFEGGDGSLEVGTIRVRGAGVFVAADWAADGGLGEGRGEGDLVVVRRENFGYGRLWRNDLQVRSRRLWLDREVLLHGLRGCRSHTREVAAGQVHLSSVLSPYFGDIPRLIRRSWPDTNHQVIDMRI